MEGIGMSGGACMIFIADVKVMDDWEIGDRTLILAEIRGG